MVSAETLPLPGPAVLAAASRPKYKCIYADPPWRTNAFFGKGLDGHYPLMTDDQLLRMGPAIRSICDPEGCHLWLWAVQKKIGLALEIMKMWGFQEEHFVFWAKPKMGLGKVRNQGELCLFGTRGNLKVEGGWQVTNFLYTPGYNGIHSEKPDEMRQIVETASPRPRLELFARGKPPLREHEWHVWGNDPGQKNDVEIEVPFDL